MKSAYFSVAALVACAAVADASPFPAQRVFDRGTPVPGDAVSTAMGYVRVNNNGDWFHQSQDDRPGGSFSYFLNGAVILQSGADLGLESGVTRSSIGVGIDDAANFGGTYTLAGATSATNNGVFFNDNLLIRKGDAFVNPRVSEGTTATGFFQSATRLNNNRQILLPASLNDPGLTGNTNRAMLRFNVDAAGTGSTVTVIGLQGDTLPGSAPGSTYTVSNFQTSSGQSDINDSGSTAYIATVTGGPGTNALYVDGTFVAENNGVSPVAGRNWATTGFNSANISLNNNGTLAYRANLAGDTSTNTLIVVGGNAFVQQGDAMPGIDGATLTGLAAADVFLADNGSLLWHATWTNADGSIATGLRLDDLPVLTVGDVIDGETVTFVPSASDAFAMSPDGNWVIARYRAGGTVDNRLALIAVPEPASAGLFLLGAAAGLRRRRN